MFRLSAVHMYFSSTIRIRKCDFKKISFFAMFRQSADLQFKCIFHKQSRSDVKVKAGSGNNKKNNNFGSTTLVQETKPLRCPGMNMKSRR
jgi:hypothetical protein